MKYNLESQHWWKCKPPVHHDPAIKVYCFRKVLPDAVSKPVTQAGSRMLQYAAKELGIDHMDPKIVWFTPASNWIEVARNLNGQRQAISDAERSEGMFQFPCDPYGYTPEQDRLESLPKRISCE